MEAASEAQKCSDNESARRNEEKPYHLPKDKVQVTSTSSSTPFLLYYPPVLGTGDCKYKKSDTVKIKDDFLYQRVIVSNVN